MHVFVSLIPHWTACFRKPGHGSDHFCMDLEHAVMNKMVKKNCTELNV